MLGKLIKRVFGKSILLTLVGASVGVLALVFLFLLFSGGPAEDLAPSDAPSAVSEGSDVILAAGEVFPVAIKGMPVPLVSPDDGTVLGFVFLDVTIEVIGAGAKQRAEARREEIMGLFSTAMAEKGAGMDGQPGAVDYERLAALFLEIARADVGAAEVARIIILPAGGS
ncbi:MAG: hypothetical protein V3R20_02150 [Sphingomonadales bacterium]